MFSSGITVERWHSSHTKSHMLCMFHCWAYWVSSAHNTVACSHTDVWDGFSIARSERWTTPTSKCPDFVAENGIPFPPPVFWCLDVGLCHKFCVAPTSQLLCSGNHIKSGCVLTFWTPTQSGLMLESIALLVLMIMAVWPVFSPPSIANASIQLQNNQSSIVCWFCFVREDTLLRYYIVTPFVAHLRGY